MHYWLFKSEPNTFSIDDLANCPHQTSSWDGVRNYQARNFLRDDIQKGDHAFFYHSTVPPIGIVGIIEIVREGYPDYTAWDSNSDHADPFSTPDDPRWFMVDVKLIEKFSRVVTLEAIKQDPRLSQMLVARKGNRLSITPVTSDEWQAVLSLV